MFDQLVEEIFALLWRLEPWRAVSLGIHEYDGRLPDWSAESVAEAVAEMRQARGRLESLDGLSTDQELDRHQLLAELDGQLLFWDSLRWWRRNPLHYLDPMYLEIYLKRSYAPKEQRVRQVLSVLREVPRFIYQAGENLEPVIPRPYCQWGTRMVRGMADFLVKDLEAELADVEDRRLVEEVGRARDLAERALRGMADWLEGELSGSADYSFPIGTASMERLLRTELVPMGAPELLEMGRADLAANLAAFRETASLIDGSLQPREVYERHVASVHPSAEELIPATADMLEGIRSFLVERDLITIPSEVRALVAETPRFMRWAFALMDIPGPYETVATEAYYYVTPVDPQWSPEQAEEWLQTLNTFALEDISIHEAYPGHYVHFLHAARAPTEASKRLWSYAFTEGWAHYCEQMAWEAGYREGDPRFRLAQLSEALVRNCRLVCAVQMHTGGMTVDEATRFFVDNAFYEETPARQEAERGTFDPAYYSYTLGKLQILGLREDYRRAKGDAYSLKGFHDALLSRGAPPVELMRGVLLG